MIRILLPLLFAPGFLSVGGGPQQGVNWMRLDTAQANSQKTGKLILLYVACDPKTGNMT